MPKRHDPSPRSLDGLTPQLALDKESKDPKRRYKLCWKAGEGGLSIEYFEYVGWEVETYRDGGPRFLLQRKGDVKAGHPMERMGHVLMSIPLELFEQIEEHGALGIGGLAISRQRDDMIFNGQAIDADPIGGENFPGMDGFRTGRGKAAVSFGQQNSRMEME